MATSYQPEIALLAGAAFIAASFLIRRMHTYQETLIEDVKRQLETLRRKRELEALQKQQLEARQRRKEAEERRMAERAKRRQERLAKKSEKTEETVAETAPAKANASG